MILGDYQEACRNLQLQGGKLAPWAQRPDVQSALLAVLVTLDGAGQRWEANGL